MVVDDRLEAELYEELYVELAEEVVVASVYVL
jgi:hypothetical protein